jgi:hypothetical protein
LPPALAPIVWYAGSNRTDFPELGTGQETAMVGPFYRYDAALNSSVKFPPYYHGKMLFWDWARFFHTLVTLDSQGGAAKIENIPVTGHTWGSDIDMIFGANGALYILQWSANGYSGGAKKFYKIEYRGPLNDASCAVHVNAPERKGDRERLVPILMGASGFRLPAGASGADFFTWDGRRIGSYTRTGPLHLEERVDLPKTIGRQLIRVRMR